ncbi:hypothetical protein, partial [Proteiniclasticum sp.]|uniref:hypothetical protein n=1 Tax=Proteiniclasticum sp. TaxID=2053595 RepID=UPI0028A169FB
MATIQNLEEEYKVFEAKIIKIEDDRKIRLDLLEWMREHNEVKLFMEHATVSILRGWVTDIEVYSSEDFKVLWVDGTTTEVGNFSEKISDYTSYIDSLYKKNSDSITKAPTMINSGKGKSLSKQTRASSADPSIEKSIETNKKGSGELYSNKQSGVIKIEPGYRDLILRSLSKILDK